MALSFTIPAALVAIFVALLLKRLTRKSLHLPPGPKPLPIIGNLLDIPTGASWTKFSPMSKQYGDIMYFKVINQHTIIISSVEVAADLFEKRSTIYSDRYHSVSLTDLMGDDWSFVLYSYGEDWRKRRKVFHQYLGPSAVREFDGHLSEHVGEYLKRLKATPEYMFEHTRWMVVAILMNIIYGIHVEDVSNKHVVEAEAWVAGVNEVLEPGRFLVDILPFLRHIPAWFPGANFKRLLLGWRENMYNARDGPFYEAKDAYTAGTSRNCIVTRILENIGDKSDSSEQETISRDSLGSAFGAGVDTSAPTLQIFFHAMMAHPEIQKRAQAQLDAVVGPDRLPTLNDRDQLPYIDAILKEVTRSAPVTPLALPHLTATDDEYRGYHIPKGSVVIPNVWHMLHDPANYPEPQLFKPERFLKPDGTLNPDILEPSTMTFGFGRRICPGQYLASNMLFLTMASVLHVFNITPTKLGEDGKSKVPELHMSPTMVSHPEPFDCSIQLRSSSREVLVSV